MGVAECFRFVFLVVISIIFVLSMMGGSLFFANSFVRELHKDYEKFQNEIHGKAPVEEVPTLNGGDGE